MSKKIAICSSMQFKKEIVGVVATLEQAGFIVFTPDLSEKSTSYLEYTAEEQRKAKQGFIKAHFEKIKQVDAILVLNYEKKGIVGYIGSNTLMEIGIAFYLGKEIYILNSLTDQGCKEEVMALATKFLDGDLASFQ